MLAKNHDLDAVMKILRDRRNLDLSGYRRAPLGQRLALRAAVLRTGTLSRYLERLAHDEKEIDELLHALPLPVTEFFRDREIWDLLKGTLLPDLLLRREEQRTFRAWSAGCASGQEGYSLAMAVAEVLGPAIETWDVKIFATNMDWRLIERARTGIYTKRQVETLSPLRLERWWELRPNNTYRIRHEIRRHLVFGRHDLLRDAPLPRMDLILCRNVLMYFMKITQRRVLEHFRDVLASDGVLILGTGESVPTTFSGFKRIDSVLRIYRADRQVRATADVV
jgi:two-component system CheB/CheR fusion protein